LRKGGTSNSGGLQNIRPSGPEKEQPQTYHNQNTQHIEQRKNTESCKREKQVTYKGKPMRVTIDFSTKTQNTGQRKIYFRS
jgi:hypothetical protein